MMQQTFGKPDDTDIDGTHDGRLSLLRENKFCTPSADVQRQDIGNSLGKTGTDTEHRPLGFLFAGENLDVKARLGFDAIHELLSILRVTDGARSHGRARVHLMAVDDFSPFSQALHNTIHRLELQAL